MLGLPAMRETVLVLLALAAPAACDERRPTPPPPPENVAPLASLARAAGLDGAALEPAVVVDPAAPAGDLKVDIDTFTTIDACVTAHAHLDPLVGDALEAIGYDTFLRDTCRVVDAAKARDPKRCDPIVSSGLRTRCLATVAQVKGDADACPWTVASKPARGRDAACVAVALRDVRLCAGASDALSRATCEATVRRDGRAPCAALASRADQARCARDAERWRSVVPSPERDLPALAPVSATLHVESAAAGAPIESDFSAELARGLVAVDQRDGTRIVLGPLTDVGGAFIAPSPQARATIALELVVPAGGQGVRIERAELQLPGRATTTTPIARSTLVARVDKFEPTRGGEVSLSVEGDLVDAAAAHHIRVRATTFVRDVVKAAALYGGSLGASGGMR
jgi:hypothetical protein